MLFWRRSRSVDTRDILLEFSSLHTHCAQRHQGIDLLQTGFRKTWANSLSVAQAPSCASSRPEKSRGWERGAAGSAVRTLMNKRESGETSLFKVVPFNRRPTWKRLADKSPRPPRSWTGTWSGGRAIPESCGPNTQTCQLRFGWKWRWRLSISSACLWPLSYWWFIMFSSGHRIHITTSTAPGYPTAPSAHPGLDDTHSPQGGWPYLAWSSSREGWERTAHRLKPEVWKPSVDRAEGERVTGMRQQDLRIATLMRSSFTTLKEGAYFPHISGKKKKPVFVFFPIIE